MRFEDELFEQVDALMGIPERDRIAAPPSREVEREEHRRNLFAYERARLARAEQRMAQLRKEQAENRREFVAGLPEPEWASEAEERRFEAEGDELRAAGLLDEGAR